MEEQAWTIGRLLSWTADFLKEKGAESPRLDAELLLAHARGCRRIELYTAYEEPATDSLRTSFRGLVKQRAAGKPVAYLVGYREFFSLAFEVTSDVLIPRPETEALVVRGIDLIKQRDAATEDCAPRIADVGTGSGVLAVCLTRQLPNAQATAIDVSQAALQVAQRNAARHKVEQRIDFLRSDLFDQVPSEARFDLIVSNPPYVTTDELAELATDVRKYEPRLALDGGVDGVRVIERLLPQAAVRLAGQGRLLMEIGPSIASRVERLVAAQSSLELAAVHRDLSGLPRMVEAFRKG